VDSKQRETIIKLQKLNPNSIEFYDVAASYFSRRCRSNRTCGIFFLLCALVGLMGIFAPWENLSGHITGIFVFSFSAWIGWSVFRLGQTQLVLIKTHRVAGLKYQENALRFFCNRDYCSQPIGVFILRRLGDANAQATLHPLSSKGRKRDQSLLKLFGKKYTDQEHEQWLESKEEILRDKVNQELAELVPK
jgi:hypothetical protein